MKYFSRELVDAVGRGSAAAYEQWRRASARYGRSRDAIVYRAARDVRALATSSFHDSLLEKVCMDPAQLTLILTGTRSWLASGKMLWGVHRLELRDVASSTLGVQHVGLNWGYEEISRRGPDYELRVLPETGEHFVVRFRRVRIRSNALS